MVYTCLPAVYYHCSLDATKSVCWQAGFSAVPMVFLVQSVIISARPKTNKFRSLHFLVLHYYPLCSESYNGVNDLCSPMVEMDPKRPCTDHLGQPITSQFKF